MVCNSFAPNPIGKEDETDSLDRLDKYWHVVGKMYYRGAREKGVLQKEIAVSHETEPELNETF